jgi:hypothetical protein
MTRSLVAATLLVIALPLGAEEVYKWIDAQGVVHYSATPPPGQAVPPHDLRYYRGDAAAAAAAQQREQAQIQQRREAQTKSTQLAAQQGTEAAQRRHLCEQAREVIGRLQNPTARIQREDGSYQRYTDEERSELLSEAGARAQQNCD